MYAFICGKSSQLVRALDLKCKAYGFSPPLPHWSVVTLYLYRDLTENITLCITEVLSNNRALLNIGRRAIIIQCSCIVYIHV